MLRTTLLWVSLALIGFTTNLCGELPDHARFAQEESDLPADPRVHFGKLPNGLRYAILSNPEPKNRASLRLVVFAGSAEETDAQQGLAHFVEHLAFKGTTHYPPGTIVKYFQRLGMGFGNDANAYTEFERTVYLLELPNTETHTVSEAFQVLCDDARGELILAPEIESERNVILSEKRDRDSQDYRRFVALDDFLHGDLLLSKRHPIGKVDVIEHAPAAEFRRYYDQWYRPERMAIIAVGDFDAASVEAQLQSSARELNTPVPAAPDPSLGKVADFKGERVLYFPQPEAANTLVVDEFIRPCAHEPDTRENRVKHLPRWLTLSMLNRRLGKLSRATDAPFLFGEFYFSHQFDFIETAGFNFTCKPENWRDALAVGEKELRRALAVGFTQPELDEAVAHLRHSLEEAVKTSSTRRSPELAGELLTCLAHGTVFTTPQEDLAVESPALEHITPADCLASLREDFRDSGHSLAVVGNAKISPRPDVAPEEQIRAAFLAAQEGKIDPAATETNAAFAYTDFGPPGKIAERRHIDDLDVDLITFSNGVRLNLKKTNFEANQVEAALRVGSGLLSEPRSQPGLAAFTRSTFVGGGLGKHSIDDLIRLSAAHTIGLDFRVDSDAFRFGASTSPGDLRFQLQLWTAYLADPGYRTETMAVARKRFDATYSKLEHTPDGVMRLKVERELASGDPRFGMVDKAIMESRNLDEERAWLTPSFRDGPIEVALVGDFDREAAIQAVAETLGTLPPRASKGAWAKEREVHFPTPFGQILEVETEIPRALVSVSWPTADSRDVQRQRRLALLAYVFSDRLRIELRDHLGSAYSPWARDIASETFPEYGSMQAHVEADPPRAVQIRDAVLKIAQDLSAGGITQDELGRAKEPILTLLRESARTNGYWLGSVLESAQENPQHLDWCRTRYSDTEAITAAELDALAKEYLSAERAFRIIITPKPTPAPGS